MQQHTHTYTHMHMHALTQSQSTHMHMHTHATTTTLLMTLHYLHYHYYHHTAGVNGAGKTTQLQIIMGRVQPDAGEVIKAKRNMRVAYLAQVGAHMHVHVCTCMRTCRLRSRMCV